MLSNNLKQISMLIGNMFMPMIQKVMPYINAMAIAVKDLIQWISNLFGLKWENTAQAAPDMSEYDTGYDDDNTYQAIADDAEDAANATDKATEAQKKFNKQLSKFDELNNYTFTKTDDKDKGKDKGKDKNISDANADVSGVLSNALIAAVQDYEKQWNKAFQSMQNSAANLAKTIEDLFKRAWNTGDGTEIGEALATTINKGIEWVNQHTDQFSNGLNKIASILGTSLNGFVKKLDFSGLGKAIGNSIKAALEAEEVFFDSVNWTNLGKRIAESLNTFVDSGVIQQYFETAASKINAAIGTALGAVNEFNFSGLGKAIAEGLNKFIKKTDFNKTGKLVAGFVNGAAKTALTFAGNFNFKGVGKAIATFINSALGDIKWKTILTAASAWGKGIAEAINSFFKETDFTLIGSTVGNFINTAINFALSAGKELDFKGIGQKIADGINGVFATIDFAGLAETINTWVKGALTTVTTLLQETDFEAIGQKIGTFLAELDILSMMGQFAQMLWEAIKAGFSLLGGLIQEAPLETALIAAFAAFKFLGIGSVIGSAISSAISSALVTNLAGKLGVDLMADSSITSVLSTALSTKLAPAIKVVTDNIGTIATAVGVAVGSFTEFNVAKGAMENLTLGIENSTLGVGDLIIEIGKIAGAVALAVKAFTAALGQPAGTIIALIAGAVGAIKGISDAFEEIEAESAMTSVADALKKPGGTPIEDLTKLYEDNINTIKSGFDGINEKSKELETTQNNAEATSKKIDLIKFAVENGSQATEENTVKIKDAFDSLLSDTESIFEQEYDVIMTGISGSLQQSLKDAGYSVQEIVGVMDNLKDGHQKAIDDIKTKNEELSKSFEAGEITNEEYQAKLLENYEELGKITGKTDEYTTSINKVSDAIKDVDLSSIVNEDNTINTEKLSGTFKQLSNTADDAKKSINESSEGLTSAVEDYRAEAERVGNSEAATVLSDMLSAEKENVKNATDGVNGELTAYGEAVETALIEKIPTVIEEAKKKYGEKGFLYQSLHSESDDVQKAIEEYQANTIDPAGKELERLYSEAGVDWSSKASSATEGVLKSLFEPYNDNGVYTIAYDSLQGNYSDVIEKAVKEVSATAGKGGKEITQTMSDGMPEGVDEKKADEAGKKLTNKAKKSIDKKELKKSGKEGGKALSDGIPEGVDTKKAESAGKKVADKVTDKAIKEIKAKSKDIGSQAVNSTVTGLDENWKKVDDWWKKAKMPEVKFIIEDIKSKVSAKWKEVTDWWGESRKLKVDISFITNENNVSSWWEKIKNWWGKKKLEVSNDFKTTEPEVNKWWTNKVKSWWGTKKLEVDSKFITDENKDVKKWWTDKIKKWWGKKELEVGSKLITIKDEINDEWWTNKIKKWWGIKNVKVGTDYTTTKQEVNGWGENTVKWLKSGISGAWGDFSRWFLDKFKGIVNKVVAGLNWVLKEVGSDDRVDKWTPKYAKGSSGLSRDTIGIVNDQSGNTYREMIVPPHGKPFIPKGRNVTLPMEKGTKIMPARQTKKFIESMPHFAKGMGKFSGNIFDYFDKPEKIIHIATDKFVDYSNLKKVSLSISKGAVNTLKDGAVDFIKKAFASSGSPGIESAVNWAIGIANDDSHGYSQELSIRWGHPDYDCSSLVISAFEQAGIKLKSANATNTRDMYGAAKQVGFSDVTKSVNLGTAEGMQRGDILLTPAKHTALYIGNGQIVHASIDENGNISGGKPGDQNGREILTRSYYNKPWTYVLRYTKGGTAGGGVTGGYTSKGEPNTPKVEYNPSAGVAQWRSLAKRALEITGYYTPENLELMLKQIKTESDGNPKSINLYDSNAKRGTPSKGILQVIDPTFKEYAMKGYDTDIWDPLSNMIAAIRYVVTKPGGLSAWWGKGHGYATGIGKITLSDVIGTYASGGLPPTGQMFVAREDGAELVGNIGNSTAVMNNDQIVESVAKGVKDAIISIININDIISWITTGVAGALQAFSGNGGNIFAENSATAGNGSSVVVGYKDKVGNPDLNIVLEQTVNIKSVSDKILDFASFTNEISSMFSDVKKGLQQIIDDSILAVKSLGDVAQTASTFLQNEFSDAAEWTKTNVIDTISTLIDDFVNSINEKASEVKGTVQTEMSEIPSLIESDATSQILTKFTDLFGQITENYSSTWQELQDKLSEIPSYIEENITSSILSKFTNLFTQIQEGFSGMWSDVSTTADTEIEKITDTIKNKVIGKIQDIVIEADSAIAKLGKLSELQSTTKVKKSQTKVSKDVNNTIQKTAKQKETKESKDTAVKTEYVKSDKKEPEKTSDKKYETANLKTINNVPKLTTAKLTSVSKETADTFVNNVSEPVENALNRIKNAFQSFDITSKIKVKRYAKGGISKDELGVVNDQSGNVYKELVIPPYGTPFIPEGRNVTLPLKKGTRIIPADKTKKFLNSLPHFANGTEDFDGDKKSKSGGSGIVDGIHKVIDDTIVPYIREMIRILEGNAKNSGTTVATSNKKTTTKYSDTVKEIQKAWTDLAKWFETTVVQPIETAFATMKTNILEIFSTTNEEMTKSYAEVLPEWQETLKEIPEWITENIGNTISENFTEFCSELGENLGTAWEEIQSELSEIPDWFETNITSSILTKFTELFTQVKGGFSTMWSDVSLSASQELEKVTSTADGVIGKLQEIINKANDAIATIERVTQAQNEAAMQAQIKQTTVDISNAVQEVTSQLGNSVISTAVASVGGFNNNIQKQEEARQKETKKEEYETAKLQTINTEKKTGSLNSNIQYTTGEISSVAQETANVFETIKESSEKTLDRLKNVAGKIKFKRYDTGGFPEDGWFRASKGEFMGQFDDGTSYVANNQQIQKAISAEVGGAVYNAVIAAMSNSGNNNSGDIVVNVDGESLFRIIKNKDSSFYSRTGRGAFEH